MAECWRPLDGFDYEVSTSGRVRRVLANSRRLLKPYPQKGGYLLVTLSRDGQRFRRLVHRLVLRAFRGPSSLHTHHKNAKKRDNRLANLEYVTPSQNRRHAQRMGLQPSSYTLRPWCSHGHAMTIANTRWSRDSRGRLFRACRACCRENTRRYAERKGIR